MPGQGAFMQRLPAAGLPVTSDAFSSTNIGCTPGMGSEAQLGIAGVTPARLEIRVPAVSVCHQVSTIGHFRLPICSSYQCQVCSLMGTPPVHNTCTMDKSFPSSGF